MENEKGPSREEQLAKSEKKVAEEAVDSSDEVAAHRHVEALEPNRQRTEAINKELHDGIQRSEVILTFLKETIIGGNEGVREFLDEDNYSYDPDKDLYGLIRALKVANTQRYEFEKVVERVKEEHEKAYAVRTEKARMLREESQNAEWQPTPIEDGDVAPAEPTEEPTKE